MSPLSLSKLKKKTLSEIQTKPKSKINRFNGLTEEEVKQNSLPLPDYLKMNLDLVFVGINPSLTAAFRGRYYAGPGNHFYKLLHESGLVPKFVSFEEDHQLLQFGIGLTNIVERATRSSADLSRAEIKTGSVTVEKKLREFKPKVAVFNGRCIYDVFANKTGKSEFNFGLQSERIGETALWVVPSSSARCSNFPRMVDKLEFYLSLKKYLSFLKGEISEVDVKEFFFQGKNKEYESNTSAVWRRKNISLFPNGRIIANKNTLSNEISDENIAFANNDFVIKEIKSKNGIESLQENVDSKKGFEEVSGQEKNSKVFETDDINFIENTKEDQYSVSDTLFVNKAIKKESRTNKRSRNSLMKLSDFRPKKRREENSSNFVSLIKQRLEAQKRKVEDLET